MALAKSRTRTRRGRGWRRTLADYQHSFLLFGMIHITGIISTPLLAQSTIWNWGIEKPNGQCPVTYTEPAGLLKGLWFNYNAGWTEAATNPTPRAMFPGWVNPRNVQHGLCYEGTIASIMTYFAWPDRSQIIGDYQAGEPVFIDYTWKYSQIAPPYPASYANDNVFTRALSGCNTSGFCNVSDEIARLFVAARVACNGYYHVPAVLASGLPVRYVHIFKNRLGFSNATFVSGSDPNLQSIISTEIQNNRPIVQHGAGHAWVLDGARVNGNVFQVHKLDGATACYEAAVSKRHPAQWIDLITNTNNNASGTNFITNLNPNVTISKGATVERTFVYGPEQIPGFNHRFMKMRLRLVRAPNTSGTENITVRIYASRYASGSWNPVYGDMVPLTNIPLSPTGNISPTFAFDIPTNDSIRIHVSMKNTATSTRTIRIILEEPSDLERLVISKSGALKMEIKQDGTTRITGDVVQGPSHQIGAGSLTYRYNPNSYYNMLSKDNGDFSTYWGLGQNNPYGVLDNPGYVADGFRYSFAGKAVLHCKNYQKAATRRECFNDRSILPIYIISLPQEVHILETMSIAFAKGPGSTVAQVNLYRSTDQANWTVIVSNLSVNNSPHNWTVPDNLANQNVWFKIADANNLGTYSVYSKSVLVRGSSQMIHLPAPGATLTRGSQVTIKWEFRPTASVNVYASPDDGLNWGQTLNSSAVPNNVEDFTWNIPANWPSNRIMFKVQEYSSSRSAETTNFAVN